MRALLTAALLSASLAVSAAGADTAAAQPATALLAGPRQEAVAGAPRNPHDTELSSALSWHQLHPATEPSDVDTEAMAYDAAMAATILYTVPTKGQGATATWSWDGSTWTNLGVKSPPERYYSAAAYDEKRGQIVLFGGFDGVHSLGDTWVFDDGTWSELHPATSPSPREGAIMAYDPSLGQVILFGGNNGPYLDDTWAFDGSTWSQLKPKDSPPALGFTDMTYDPGRSALVLFGGSNDRRVTCSHESGSDQCQTWSWDGHTWTRLRPDASPPALRNFAMATVDDRPTIFGGFSNSPFGSHDTWALGDSAWSRIAEHPHPHVGYNLQLVGDGDAGSALLIGTNRKEGHTGTWSLDSQDVGAGRRSATVGR